MSITEITFTENVDFETYLQEYAADHAEWINGAVIKMSPVSLAHLKITHFIIMLFTRYLEKTGEGEVCSEPFVMKINNRGREPDVFVVTTAHLERLKPTYLDGAADLVVEVVSEDSVDRDRGEKFREYETGGVREYWIIDPLRKETLFYTLEEELFRPHPPDKDGIYTSKVLPRLQIEAGILLKSPPPGFGDVDEIVTKMLTD